MQESQQLFFGGELVNGLFEEFQHSGIHTKQCIKCLFSFLFQFHQCKSAPANIGRKDSIQSVCRRSLRFEAFLYEAAHVFINIQDKNLKNQKPIAVDIFIKGYPIVPLSSRSNRAGHTFKDFFFFFTASAGKYVSQLE